MFKVRSLEKAIEVVHSRCLKKDEHEIVKLVDSLNRVLACELVSSSNVPDFSRSTVDGYCLLSNDTFGCSDSMPAILKKVGNVKIGENPSFCIKSGQCAYIPTGGQLPKGVDSVSMIEHTYDYGDEIGIFKPIAPGNNIVFKGEDIKENQILLQKGTKINSRHVGILVACGISEVIVFKRINVAVVSTGNELIPHGEKLERGKIYDVNAPMLVSAIREYGCTAENLGIIFDEKDIIEKILSELITKYDIVVISGGTSVGIKDLTTEVLEKMGTILVHGIAVKPGKPTIIAYVNEKMIFGLPGNPLAAFFMYHLIVKKAINSMYGLVEKERTEIKKLHITISSNHGREEYIPVKIKDHEVYPVLGGSGLISSLKDACGYIYISRDMEGLSKGTMVKVVYFD